MIRSVFFPDRSNLFAWLNVLFMVMLLITGKIEPYAILFGYFFETLIIGLFNIFKMYDSYKSHDKTSPILYTIVFFIIHYGAFVAIQSIFVFAVFSIEGHSFIREPFHLIENFKIILGLDGMAYVLPLLSITQLVKYYFDFLLPKKYLKFKVNEIMFKPYLRIVIQQFTVIISMFFILFSEASIFAACLLIILRFIVDVLFVAIKTNSALLNFLVEKLDDGKVDKATLKHQLQLLTE